MITDRTDLDRWLSSGAWFREHDPATYAIWLREFPTPPVLRFPYRWDAVHYRKVRRESHTTIDSSDGPWRCAPLRDRSPLHWRTGPTYTSPRN